jgi:hypothetical protein
MTSRWGDLDLVIQEVLHPHKAMSLTGESQGSLSAMPIA